MEPSGFTREVQIGRILDELSARRARGEPVDESAILAAHPDLVPELQSHFQVLRAIEGMRAPTEQLVRRGIIAPTSAGNYTGRIGPYLVSDILGRGGMGVVLRARDEALERWVALKVLRPEFADTATALARFELEARAAAGLRHPHIVTVHGFGHCEGLPYIAMELVEGPTLAELIRTHGPLPDPLVRHVLRGLLSGLAAAHAAGFVHRDIKSANILLELERAGDPPPLETLRPGVKIADFGLTRSVLAQTRITETEAALGTLEYMSPEQIRGADVDARADLYSAGVVLYEMLTGRTPFTAPSPSVLLHRVLNEEPVPPPRVVPDADPALARLALRLMAKGPADRLPSTEEALRVLDSGRRLGQWRPRRIAKLAALLGVALAAGGELAGWLLWHPPSRANAVRVSAQDPRLLEIKYEGRATFQPFRLFPTRIATRFGLEDMGAARIVDLSKPAEQRVFVSLALAEADPATYRPGQTVAPMYAYDARAPDPTAAAPDVQALFSLDLTKAADWPDCSPPHRVWPIRLLCAGELQSGQGTVLVVAAYKDAEYPTRLAVVDARTGEVRASFWHLGNLHGAAILPEFPFLDAGGREVKRGPAIFAWGINNKLDGFFASGSGHDDAPPASEAERAQHGDDTPVTCWDWVSVAMILDAEDLNGIGPPRSGARLDDARAKCEIGASTPYAYAFLDMAYTATQGAWCAGDSQRRPAPEGDVGAIANCDVPVPYASISPSWRIIAHATSRMTPTAPDAEAGTVPIELDTDLSCEFAKPGPGSGPSESNRWKRRWKVLIRRFEYQPLVIDRRACGE